MNPIALIQHYNRLNGNSISLAKLKAFHQSVQSCLDSVGHGPYVPDLKGILHRSTKAIKMMIENETDLVEKIELTPVALKKETEVRSKVEGIKETDENLLSGLEQIQNDADLKVGDFGEVGETTYKVITDKILSLIEKDGLIWRKPWNENHAGRESHAHNVVTKSYYRGTNFYLNYLLLSDYKSPYFLTFKQVDQKGGKVKAGQKGWPVIYFKYIYKRTKGNVLVEETEAMAGSKLKPGYSRFPALFYYVVFNAEQCDGLDLKPFKEVKISLKEKIESAETIVEGMPQRPPIAKVRGDRAYYVPSSDSITMPLIEQFKLEQEYYSTLFHELVHSTGSPKRIGRDLTGKFGSKSYAFEELIAELGASYLCGESGILYFTLDNTAAYLKGWLKRLKEEMTTDPKFFLKAAAAAEKASEFIIARSKAVKKKEIKQKARKPVKRKEASVPGVKASVAQAIDDLVVAKPQKYAKKAMAMQMLYAKFKNESEQELEQDSLIHKLLEKENWIEYERGTSHALHSSNNIYSITEKGKEVIASIDARLTSLRIKKQGGELFPDLKGTKKTRGKAVKPENKSLVKATKPSHPQEGAAQKTPSPPERAGVRSHEIKKHFAKELKKKVFGQKVSKSLSGVDYSYKEIELGAYKKDFHRMFSDTIALIWGMPGHGKTVYLLKYAQYRAEHDDNVLYVAREEYGRSVFDMKLKEHNINHKNLRFRRELSPKDLKWATVIFLDSVSALKLNHEDIEELSLQYPNKNWVLVLQSTKGGDFRGSQEWEHLVDVAGEISHRKLILRKNRLDPNNSTKAAKLMTDDAIAEARSKQAIRQAVKDSVPKPPTEVAA